MAPFPKLISFCVVKIKGTLQQGSADVYQGVAQNCCTTNSAQGGYDLKVGTSERGSVQGACELRLPSHRHALIAFGGPTGLEECLNKDPQKAVDDASTLFDHWLNTCPSQGSRTIRTEEALLISLAYLQPGLQHAGN